MQNIYSEYIQVRKKKKRKAVDLQKSDNNGVRILANTMNTKDVYITLPLAKRGRNGVGINN